jgi:hypothetical protein
MAARSIWIEYPDNEDCVLMFKKLETVYGKEYFMVEY